MTFAIAAMPAIQQQSALSSPQKIPGQRVDLRGLALILRRPCSRDRRGMDRPQSNPIPRQIFRRVVLQFPAGVRLHSKLFLNRCRQAGQLEVSIKFDPDKKKPLASGAGTCEGRRQNKSDKSKFMTWMIKINTPHVVFHELFARKPFANSCPMSHCPNVFLSFDYSAKQLSE